MTPAPVYIGFWLSKPGFDRLVERQSKGQAGPATITQVGIYPYQDIYAGRGQPPRRTVNIGHTGGFVYSPEQHPDPRASYYRYRYMGAGWYSFEWKLP